MLISACPRDYSRCWTYDHCVPWNALCDRQVDCVDESDEKYCGMYVTDKLDPPKSFEEQCKRAFISGEQLKKGQILGKQGDKDNIRNKNI